jgi:hypothetical protein
MSSLREQLEQLMALPEHAPTYRAWCVANREVIAAALKTAEAFDRGESDDDHAGYYSHERDYAARMLVRVSDSPDAMFKRGFLEGWKAARRFVIQDP